jgi:hypothetical protein
VTPSSGRRDASTDASVDFARRLVTQATGDSTGEAARNSAADAVFVAVADGLARWFGPYGSLALVSRALSSVQRQHAALAGVTVTASVLTRSPALSGIAECRRSHSEGDVTEGVIAILASLTDLIGRLIGEDLAANLLEQSVARGTAALTNDGRQMSDDNQPIVNSND